MLKMNFNFDTPGQGGLAYISTPWCVSPACRRTSPGMPAMGIPPGVVAWGGAESLP
jgi:hypothetical protein